MDETATCLGCGREAEMEYEPEPSAERDIPVLPTGWEAEDDDEYYCGDCVAQKLRAQVEQLQSQLTTARHDLAIANEAFEANSRRLVACKQEVTKLTEMRQVGHGRLEALVRRAYVERIGSDWIEEAESVLGLSKTQNGRRSLRTDVECDRCEKLARAKELEESAKAVTRSVQEENARLRNPGEVRSAPGEVLTLDLKGGQVQVWVTTTGVMCLRLAEQPRVEVIVCPECGPVENTDEEACCLSCGLDCTIHPAYEYWQQLAEKFGRRGDILNDHLRQVMEPIEDLRKKVEDARHDQEKDLVWEVDDLDEFLCDVFGTCNDCSCYSGGDGDGECHNDKSDHHGEHRTDQPMCKDAG